MSKSTPAPPASPAVHVAKTDDQLRLCYPVMRELRPHIVTVEDFVARVRRQGEQAGYVLAYVCDESGQAAACAGYRITEFLAWGRTLYVDDLVSCQNSRHKGLGKVLMQWLTEQARAAGCEQFHLDSGTQRWEAHQFYFRVGLKITAYHFAVTLKDRAG